MAKDRLVVTDGARDSFGIAWWLPEDDDFGASIGEDEDLLPWDDFKKKLEDTPLADIRLWYECERLAREDLVSGDAWRSDRAFGIWWYSRKKANKTLREAKTRTKLFMEGDGQDTQQWPEWAQTALSHGWKPPKGWTP